MKLSETEAKNLNLESKAEDSDKPQSDASILSGQDDMETDNVVTKALIKDLENSKNNLDKKAEETLQNF